MSCTAASIQEVDKALKEGHGINDAEFTTLGMLRTTRPAMRRSPTELRRLVSAPSERLGRRTERERDAWTRALDEILAFLDPGEAP